MGQLQVYRASRGWKILTALVAALFTVIGGLLMLNPFFEGSPVTRGKIAFCLLLGAGLMLFFLYSLLSVFKTRLEVYSDRLRSIGLFRTTEVRIEDALGFRIISCSYGAMLQILPKNPKSKKINTELIFEHRADLFEWLNLNLKNLDALEYHEEISRVLKDDSHGLTEDQRLWKLNRARGWSKILNGSCLVIVLMGLFRPKPYPLVMWALILLPLLALGFARHFQGISQFGGKEQSPLPDFAPVFCMSCLILAFRAYSDFNILSWNQFWLPFAAFTVAVCLLILMLVKDVIRQPISEKITQVFFCALYGYSSVICLNGILDKSAPSIYEAQVIEKRISSGRPTTYHLTLSPWGPRKKFGEVDVGSSVYQRYEAGDSAKVIVRNGKFGIPWFYIR